MGFLSDLGSTLSGDSSSYSSGSISLPSIRFPSLNLESAPSIPSYGSIAFGGAITPTFASLPSFSPFLGSLGGYVAPNIMQPLPAITEGINKPIELITEKINNTLGSIIGQITGVAGDYGELQATQMTGLTQFQQDFNAQLSSLQTKIAQNLEPFWSKITDVGALMELLSNPETIIIIVGVVIAIAVGLYVAYKFYWSKIEFGESAIDKYTKRGVEAAKIFK